MKLCLDAPWGEFVEDAKSSGEGIYLFGASSLGRMFLEQITETFHVLGIIDNDSEKWGRQLPAFGKMLPIGGIDILKAAGENDIVLIASTWYLDIVQQLNEFGYKGKVYSFLNMRNIYGGGSSDSSIKEFEEHFGRIKELMADEESVRILQAILDKRKGFKTDYSDIKSDNEYFLPGIVKKRKDAVYVDAGAYDGDTVKKFIEFQDGEFQKVAAFEMDKNNYDKIDFGSFDKRVKFYNCGLWNEKKVVSAMSSEMASSFSEIGNKKAQVVTLDEIMENEHVTLIKMDIEGAEVEALQGAAQTIKRDKPDLAICVYHRREDIWEIPLLLSEMVGQYKFYLRHHGDLIMDTVLYATVG